MNRTEFWLRLLMVNGIKTAFLRQMSSRLLTDNIIVDSMLYQLGINQQQRQQFYQADEHYLTKALDWLNIAGNLLVTYAENDYPGLLRHIKDPPVVLFISGNAGLLSLSQLAIVGRRDCSYYGEQWARYFTMELAACDLVITSGLALGIDSICHQAALDVNGKTIAVLGSGLANITPTSHKPLAERILVQGGALISEFLPTEEAIPQHFPRRNRIISGLSQGVLVIEAALRSGSLITARCALEQGREVFALPGPIGNNGSEGTHWLIQQGANLVVKPSEIIECLNSSLQWLTDINIPLPDDELLLEDEVINADKVLQSVGDETTPLDVIVARCELTISDVSVRLLDLELEGYISVVQGGYVRNRAIPANLRRTKLDIES